MRQIVSMDERVKKINVSVAYAGSEWSGEVALRMPAGANARDAITTSGIGRHLKGFSIDAVVFGVWGKVKSSGYVLREGDRVEIYRPLQADPKDARRAKVDTKKR